MRAPRSRDVGTRGRGGETLNPGAPGCKHGSTPRSRDASTVKGSKVKGAMKGVQSMPYNAGRWAERWGVC